MKGEGGTDEFRLYESEQGATLSLELRADQQTRERATTSGGDV